MTLKSTVTILGLAALAIGPALAALLPMAGFDVAYAESGKSNGNGKSESKSSESRGNSANAHASNGGSGGQSKAASADGTSHGDLASELKGLNAVKANPNALEHASPNSQVGRIATYRDAAEVTIGAQAALEEAAEALADLPVPERGTDEIDAAIAELDPNAAGYAEELAALQEERAIAEEYEDAVEAVADAAEQVDEAAETEKAALLAASGGRELSDEAIAYIRSVLNL